VNNPRSASSDSAARRPSAGAPVSRSVVRVIVWVGLGLAFGLWVAATRGANAAAEYYAAYFLEESLSVDNIFVFAIVFALDSVPAVLSITRDPFIVYSSNVMAMLGLRSLYFVLSDALFRLRYLRTGLALVLVFTGTKMLASEWIHISAGTSVLVIVLVLLSTILASAVFGNELSQQKQI
jgi:predicted tellurium resistance membrane protein TerC